MLPICTSKFSQKRKPSTLQKAETHAETAQKQRNNWHAEGSSRPRPEAETNVGAHQPAARATARARVRLLGLVQLRRHRAEKPRVRRGRASRFPRVVCKRHATPTTLRLAASRSHSHRVACAGSPQPCSRGRRRRRPRHRPGDVDRFGKAS
jgi:hypothetical protein